MAEVARAGCVIVGMTTYGQYKKSIYAAPGIMNFVVTGRAGSLTPTANTTFVMPDAAAIVRQLQRQGFERAVLSGGSQTASLFAAAGLIHEIRVSIYPRCIGTGIPMLGDAAGQLQLQLLTSRQLGHGVVHNRYRVQAAP